MWYKPLTIGGESVVASYEALASLITGVLPTLGESPYERVPAARYGFVIVCGYYTFWFSKNMSVDVGGTELYRL